MRATKSFSGWASRCLAVSLLHSVASVCSCKNPAGCFLAGLTLLAAACPNTRAQAGEATNLTDRLSQTWIFEPLGRVGGTPPPENETRLLLESARAITEKAIAASKVLVTTTNGDTITKMHPLVELDLASLEEFVRTHPASPWTPALESQMAKYYREHGYYTLALKHWESAWAATKALDGTGKEIADITFAHWTSLLASLGRLNQLKTLFAETESRVFDGGVLQQLINSTREGAMSMQISPATSYQCGTFALQQLAQTLNATNQTAREFLYVPSPETGFSMDRLAGLAQQAGLDLVAVRRHDEELVVPSIVHWRQNHYAAIVAQRGEFYRVLDPTFGGPNWLSKAAINAEASGSFLVPRRQVPKGWTSLAAPELSSIYGKGAPNLISDTNDQHSCNLPGYNGQECTANCQHTARWWVSEPYSTLWLEDEPLGYQPSRGARMAFHLSFKQRNSRPDSDSTTTFFNAGKLWEASWMSRISIANFQSGQNVIPPNPPTPWATYDPATVYLAGGGASFFSNTNFLGDPYAQEANKINQTRLVPLFDASLNFTGFNLLYADGSHDLYTNVITDVTSVPIDALLTASVDSIGNTTTFTYAVTNISSTNYTRLTQVLDVDGHTNTLRYQNSSFPALITEVDDAYGRTNTLQYNSTGQLTNIIDPILLYSGFTYDSQGNVTKLYTKYGTTTFTATGGSTNYFGTNSNIINRSLQILDPNGGTQLYLYRDSSSVTLVPPNYTGLVPNSPLNTLENTFLQYRDSFYWNPKQYAALSTTIPGNFNATDYSKGRLRHWLHVANSATNRVSGTLSLERAPSPDGNALGLITWYDYVGKTSSNAEGTNSLPSVVARELPDLTTQYVYYRRNELGAPTNIVDTYSATNGWQTRTNVYVYSTNAIDLLQHFGPSGELLESYGYNAFHQIPSLPTPWAK